MQLHNRVIEGLAEMVVGDNTLFPYRSSYFITKFFKSCGLPYVHDGSTRRIWTKEVLENLNRHADPSSDLPSDEILRVIDELFDPFEFDHAGKDSAIALENLNKLLSRHGLCAHLDASGRCRLHNTGTGATSTPSAQATAPLSKEELDKRQELSQFLDSASEDEFTEKLLVPFFKRIGFHRVTQSGHKEKSLEYGKDLWMKFQLPTGHWLYFSAQVKRTKIDASGTGATNNVSNVLDQAKMALGYPIFDPDSNQKVLPDHVFIIAAGEITRSARNWIDQNLDASLLRQIILMGRDELLDHSARILRDLQIHIQPIEESEDVPF